MRKIKIDVLIIIEHKVRELESACLLKYKFEKLGYTVKIDSIYPNKELLPLKYCADIIFIPWAYNDSDMKYIKCFLKYSPNAKIVNLHHEQYSGQDDKNICLPFGDARQLYHISWGEKFSDGLKKCGVNVKNIFTVGNIRLDFYKNELKKIHYTKSELASKYNIPKTKKWVLFIANGYHLMDNKKIESIAVSDKDIYIKREAAVQCRQDFLNFVSNYLSEKSDIVYIYRPHPVYADLDKDDDCLKKIKERFPKNFFVIFDLAISNWLINSDICMSFHSTSAVECCLCKTPYYLFRTIYLDNRFDYAFFDNYKYIIKDYNDFEKVLDNNYYDNNILKQALKLYYVLDDGYTFEKIVDKVVKGDKIMVDKCTFNMWNKNLFKAYLKIFLGKISKNAFFKLIMKNMNDSRLLRIIEKNDDSFTDDDVKVIMKKFKGVMEKR